MAAEFQGRVKQLQENWTLACFGLRGSCLSGMKMKLLRWPTNFGGGRDRWKWLRWLTEARRRWTCGEEGAGFGQLRFLWEIRADFGGVLWWREARWRWAVSVDEDGVFAGLLRRSSREMKSKVETCTKGVGGWACGVPGVSGCFCFRWPLGCCRRAEWSKEEKSWMAAE